MLKAHRIEVASVRVPVNGKLRQECLSAHWFLTLADAREKMEAWRRFYNEDRPHSAIGYKVPIALTEPGGEAGPPP